MPHPPPLIGLPGRRTRGGEIVGYPSSLGEVPLDLYFADYASAVAAAGGLPVHLPFDGALESYAELLDAVVLPGGADIDPARYDHERGPDTYPPEPDRDEFEMRLFALAAEREMPLLGICRGHQLVNVCAGGTLHQHVPDHSRLDVAPHTEAHEVAFVPGSRLAAIYGEARTVNSLHHQTVADVGAGLVVTATADDGTVEGLEHAELPIVTVQWHPEMMTTRLRDPLFAWLVETARSYRAAFAPR